MKFAVQLYSLREYIAENGLESALKIVSDAGFEGVEFAGFYGMKAEEIAALLEKYGLSPFRRTSATTLSPPNCRR